jgi:hypothetical protein
MRTVEIESRDQGSTSVVGVPPPIGTSETPDRPTVGIIGPVDISPPALVRHPIVPSSRHSPTDNEVEVEADVRLRKCSAQHDQSTSIVIGGVAQTPTRSI